MCLEQTFDREQLHARKASRLRTRHELQKAKAQQDSEQQSLIECRSNGDFRLFQVVNFNQTDTGAAALPGHDRSVCPRREGIQNR